jgi:two-component system sensor histidine kinase UhpB
MSDENSLPATPRRRYLPLLHRVVGLNALLLVLAVGVTIALLDPTRVSSFRVDEEIALLVVLLAVAVAVNVYVVRRIVGPVQTLTALARRVDLTGEGERMPSVAVWSEAGELALTFNEMLDRLEAERRDATGRVLAGQEAERLRIAQELHDQIGQELTAVLLSLARVESRVPGDLKGDVIEVQEAVRNSLEDLRQIAIELRPEALDDLGLESALAVVCERFSERTGLRITERVDPELPTLSPEIELVVYRVAQEALTNVARHSGADEAELDLEHGGGLLTLTVSDRGRGLPADHVDGTGMRGMRERATLVGAHLTIGPESAAGGCRVRLALALGDRG